jgi:hypothetical protein
MKKLSWYHLLIPLFGFIGFMIFILPNEADKSMALGLTQSPDTMFFYTRGQLYQIALDYGEEGRAFYIHQRFTFDFIWPLAYGFFLVSILIYLGQKIKKPMYKKAYMIPIISVALDYLENSMTAIVMYRFPKETRFIGDLAGFVTSLKWLFLTFSFVLIIVLICVVVFKKKR